jgi:cytidylate kinase
MTNIFISPVIAIDGPSGSGKGTVAQRAAKELGFHYLDSGAIYRVAALAALRANVSLADEPRLAQLAGQLDFGFYDERVYLEGKDVSLELRSEATGNAASTIAALPGLRVALLDRQRAFRQPPGLVADGRDMGSVVFPDAVLKIFLTASVETRAERRYKQLIEKGMSANIAQILRELRDRDARDSARTAAPLKINQDAVVLDTTNLTIEQAVEFVLKRYRATVSPPGP